MESGGNQGNPQKFLILVNYTTATKPCSNVNFLALVIVLRLFMLTLGKPG